jgi:hypothetical protein
VSGEPIYSNPAGPSLWGPTVARAALSSYGWPEGLCFVRGRKNLARCPCGVAAHAHRRHTRRCPPASGGRRHRGSTDVRTVAFPWSEELQVDSVSVVWLPAMARGWKHLEHPHSLALPTPKSGEIFVRIG